jgi:hypothetical protein
MPTQLLKFRFLLTVKNAEQPALRVLAAQHRFEALFHQLRPVDRGWAGIQSRDDPPSFQPSPASKTLAPDRPSHPISRIAPWLGSCRTGYSCYVRRRHRRGPELHGWLHLGCHHRHAQAADPEVDGVTSREQSACFDWLDDLEHVWQWEANWKGIRAATETA